MDNPNLVKCKTCGQGIAKGVSRCVHCGKDQRSFFKRHKILSVILVLMLFGLFVNLSGGIDKKIVSSKQEIITGDSVIIQEAIKIPAETLSQKNSVKKAKQYLKTLPFSKSGLITQLEFEGYSNADATYAVNQINADWREQAVKKANNYLDIMPFSKSGLKTQLEFEGYSNSDATYAVSQVGF